MEKETKIIQSEQEFLYITE